MPDELRLLREALCLCENDHFHVSTGQTWFENYTHSCGQHPAACSYISLREFFIGDDNPDKTFCVCD
ncbi:Histone-lysine N-methyltransferase 2D [Trichinella spiralis]|uniref:Histone-lysine N-methyltransferase 2D n=1 Tax=Trichinella spiralis TaxID=6334 RepID=A0ABR3L447_TRISP